MGGWLIVLLVVFGVLIVPFIISNYLAKSMRVPELGMGLGVILAAILTAGTIIFAALQPEKQLEHTIAEEDTVQDIAKKYGDISVKELINVNNIMSADDLKPGDTLRIPNPKKLEIKRGVDLSGGVILIYEVDETLSQEAAGGDTNAKVDIDALVEALAKRINPGGVKEIVIRPYGDKQVEIIIPDVDSAEVERLKRQITKAGFLRFLIIAQPAEHEALLALATAQPNARVIKKGNETLGEWIKIATTESGDLKVDGIDPRVKREPRPGVVEVLMAHDRFRVEGSHLKNTSKGFDDRMQPAVNFAMNQQGAKLFRGLTSTNLPDPQTGRESRLGIIMDNELISAPTIQSQISDRGQISGRFTDEEVEELVNVLRAGRLPAVLKTEPITENQIDPLLGADTIQKGTFAITTSIIAVLAFMCIYYRFAGLVACFALILNLILILALMILIRGAFTLPGLAGLVLTVGMSVDANVLIFERIREELKRGSALRLAIRNGFSRATSTIVDANLTTLITAFVLYIFGKDQLRGFAVTLILGIIMSMFTAIYCSRIIFDLAERRRWIKKLTMMQLLDAPKINLMSMRKLAAVASVLLIIGGLGAVAARQAGMFDIDFLGGTSVQARLKSPMPYEQVWDRLASEPAVSDDISLTQVKSATSQADTIWKIDTSLEDNKELQKRLSEKFSDTGESMFVSHTVSFDPPRLAKAKPASTTATSGSGDYVSPTPPLPSTPATLTTPPERVSSETTEETETTTPAESEPTTSSIEESVPVETAPVETTPIETAPIETVPAETTPVETTPVETAPVETAPVETVPTEVIEEVIPTEVVPSEPVPAPSDGSRLDLPSDTLFAQADITIGGAPDAVAGERSETTLRFGQRITRDTLLESIQNAAAQAGVSDPPIDLTGPQWRS